MDGDMAALALEIPVDLLQVATAKSILTMLDGALAELDKRVEWSRRLALGPLARGDFPDEAFDSSARDFLQAARRELHTLASTHFAVGRVFAVARARIGARSHPDLVEACEARRHDAFLFGKDAHTKLLEAAGYAEAAAEAFDVARGVDYTSPLWRGWTAAAEEMARAAHMEASAALEAVLGMQNEVCLEFFAAWKLLKALERDRCVKKAREVPGIIYDVATFVPSGTHDPNPSVKVAAALAALRNVLDLHNDAGRNLTSAARHLGLPRGDLWDRWSTRHDEVACAGQDVAGLLKSAADTVRKIEREGGKAPVHLLRRAREELRSARDGLRRLRSAATLEFFDCAWITLKALSE